MHARHTARWIFTLSLTAGTACYEGTSGTGSSADGTGGSDDASGSDGSGGTDDDPPAVGCEGLRPARTPLRRLTDVQYRNTIGDLFAGAITPSDNFPATSLGYDYTNEAAADEISALDVEEVMNAAEDVADQVMAAIDTVVGCDLSASCVEGFVDDFGARAFRRPLDADERALLLAAYDEGAADSPADGIGRVVAVALQMPQFLYLVESGVIDDEDPNVARLGDHELAARLSYLLWDTMPDDELRALADADALGDPETLEAQARRLLADGRADAALGRFHREWLDLPTLRGNEKDPAMYPGYGAPQVASMLAQVDRLIGGVFRGDEPTLARLFTADTVDIDANLAPIYGAPAPASGWAPLALDPTQRAGILTTPLVLAAQATQIGSSTVHRGKMVRTRVLCQPIPPPPPNATAQAPQLPPDATERERGEALMENPECGGCHLQMDGIGFGFENFDAIGAWRTTYPTGTAIDATGILASPPEGVESGEFVGAVELATRIAAADEVSTCYVEHFVRHARGGPTTTEVEECASDDLAAAFAESGQDLPQLVAAFVRGDGFRFRDVGGAP